jgi:hypothetical protein
VGYRGNDLEALNIVPWYHNLIHLFNFSKCNGKTLNEFVVLDYTEIYHLHIFLREEPLAADIRLWRNAIHQLCAGTTSLPVSLGRFICPPHITCRWFTTADMRMLYRVDNNLDILSYTAYDRREGQRTHYSSKYSWSSSKIGHHLGTHFASVTMLDSCCAIMHSKSLFPSPQAPLGTFHDRLSSYGSLSLWENLSVNRDGEWIHTGIIGGLLCIAYNGSYTAKESASLCLAGIIIFCQSSRQRLKESVAKSSDAASNYHGKLLGAVIALLILHVVAANLTLPFPKVVIHCDNRSVLSQGNSPLTSLPKKQKQANFIRLIKYLSISNNCNPIWEWVKGYTIKNKHWENCNLSEWLNDQADKLVKRALLSAIAGGSTIKVYLPFEVVKLTLSGWKVCGSPHLALKADWGY